MTDWFDGYTNLESNLKDSEKEYDIGSPNWLKGRTLLASTENLKQAIDHASTHAGDDTDDGQRLQYLMSRSSVHHLDACFVLIRNGLYNPTRSHLRFLFELYLLLRGLNKDTNRAAEIYNETKTQLKEEFTGPTTGEKLATVDEFWEIIKSERGKLKDGKQSELLWDHPSWSSLHPYSLEGLDIDIEYDEEIEGNLLDMSNAFVFGIGAQFIRTWDGTPFYWKLLERLDAMFVRIQIATGAAPPPMFDDDLKFWFGFDPW